MFPNFSLNNSTYMTKGSFIFLCKKSITNTFQWVIRFSNFYNFFFLKSCKTIFFTFCLMISINHILRILSWSSPVKITQKIIKTTKRFMTSILTFWSWRNKCFQDKGCYAPIMRFSIFSQSDAFISSVYSFSKLSWFYRWFSKTADWFKRINIAEFIGVIIWEIRNKFYHICTLYKNYLEMSRVYICVEKLS